MIEIATNLGKILEESVENSCKAQSLFFFRVRDVNPNAIKRGMSVPKNKFDCLVYHDGLLLALELKSTKAKSISFAESMIKAYQIKSLQEAADAKYIGVVPGFLFNFREPDNRAFFVHINEFIKYKDIAENEKEHEYISKVNKSSIPLAICEEIGIEIKNVKKRTRYTYFMKKLFDDLKETCLTRA